MGINEFREWVGLMVPAPYVFAFGTWIEAPANANDRFCVVQGAGGPRPNVEDRRPRYRVVLLGRRNQRQDGAELLNVAEALVQAAMAGSVPCGAANVRPAGEPVGPGFTTEARSWVQLDFEVTI